MKEIINVIGAGLAGVEAAYKAAEKGHKVRLFEMRPEKFTQPTRQIFLQNLSVATLLEGKI